LNDEIKKKKSIMQKDSKQNLEIKRIRIKTEIQNKFYIRWKGEIQKIIITRPKNKIKNKDQN
jgi:hypothetical protein